jgi:hypothetical protein
MHLYPVEPVTDPGIMKLSEIKPGMEGEGRTIFKGTKIETFKFKILGVIEKFVPDKNLIIAELESPVLAESGIIAGMSGSPAYIDGKLIGAVAYGFSFSKRPIGGITPIEDIIKIDEHNKPTYTIDISNVKVRFDKENLTHISDLLQKELVRWVNYVPHGMLSPIKLIGVHKGMDPAVLSPLSPVFGAGGFSFAASGRADSFGAGNQGNQGKQVTGKDLKVNRQLLDISPADAAAVPLIRGDFEYSASGTVTHVKGNKVYLFGHPFFNLGTVDFPLHKAEVISVVPSYQTSFKLAATRGMIGTVIQDRFSAIQAELGKKPYMIPMSVTLENRNRSFNLELVNHPLLTPVLSSISMANIFIGEYKQFGYQSLQVKGKIFIENEKNVIIDDLFSGAFASDELGSLLLAVNFFLLNNKDKNIKIQKITFDVNGSERTRNTTIENVILNKNAFYPGELIDISIHLKNDRGNTTVEKAQIKAPNLKAGTEFHLLVADKTEMIRFDTKNIKTTYFPIKLSHLIRAINNLRKNNRIYLKMVTLTRGIFIKGHEYSNLPDSLQNVLGYNTVSGDQSQMKFSTITEYQLPVPAVVSGSKLFKLKIKERSNSDVQ